MDLPLLELVACAVTAVIGALGSKKYVISKIVPVLQEAIDLLAVTRNALADGELTAEEIEAIIKEADEFMAQFQ